MKKENNKCLNCNKELEVVTGKKAKKFCDANCRQKHWQKTKVKDGKKDVVEIPREEYEELKNIKVLYAKVIKDKDQKPVAHFVLGIDTAYEDAQSKKPKENSAVVVSKMSEDGEDRVPVAVYKSGRKPQTKEQIEKLIKDVTPKGLGEKKQKHPKYKEGDPKEGSGSFFLKYGVSTYDEMK